MQILVRSCSETFTVQVGENASLNDLKNAIEDVEFIPASVQTLVMEGMTLVSGSLAGCLDELDTVELYVVELATAT